MGHSNDAKIVPFNGDSPATADGQFAAVVPGAQSGIIAAAGPDGAASVKAAEGEVMDMPRDRDVPRDVKRTSSANPDEEEARELADLGREARNVGEQGGGSEDGSTSPGGTKGPSLQHQDSFVTKVFGKAPRDEEEVLNTDEWWHVFGRKRAMDPRAGPRWRWDFVIALCVLYNFLTVPARVAFVPAEAPAHVWFGFDCLADICFVIDILVCLHTAVNLSGGAMEWDPRKCRTWYMYTTHFKVDVISAIPLEMFMFVPGVDSSIHERSRMYLRLFKTAKSLKISRLMMYLNRWEDSSQFATSAFRMFNTMVFFFSFCHISACLQFWASDIDGHPEESWVYRTEIVDAGLTTQYTQALFNSLSHMLCIGYGRVAPYTDIEVWIVMLSMVTGASFYVVLLGMMSSFMTSSDQSSAQYRQHMTTWKEYCDYRQVPKNLRARITRSLQSRYHSQKVFNEVELLSELPAGVRTDLQMHMCKELIPKVPLFRSVGKEALSTLVSMLRPMNYAEGELVYAYGDISTSMYFIEKGEVDIVLPGGDLFTTLCEGSYFGEFFLFGNRQTRTGSARAATECTLYSLSGTDFHRASAVYPEIKGNLAPLANARYEIYDDTGRRSTIPVTAATAKSQSQSDTKPNIKKIRARLDGTHVDEAGEVVPPEEVIQIRKAEEEYLRQLRLSGEVGPGGASLGGAGADDAAFAAAIAEAEAEAVGNGGPPAGRDSGEPTFVPHPPPAGGGGPAAFSSTEDLLGRPPATGRPTKNSSARVFPPGGGARAPGTLPAVEGGDKSNRRSSRQGAGGMLGDPPPPPMLDEELAEAAARGTPGARSAPSGRPSAGAGDPSEFGTPKHPAYYDYPFG